MNKTKEAVITEANRCSCGHMLYTEHTTGYGDCKHGCADDKCEARAASNAFRDLFQRGVTPAEYEMPEPAYSRRNPFVRDELEKA